jgi:hypothetical protein
MVRAKYRLGCSRHFPMVALGPGHQAASRRASGSGTSSKLAGVPPEGVARAEIFTRTGRTPHNLARRTSVNVSGAAALFGFDLPTASRIDKSIRRAPGITSALVVFVGACFRVLPTPSSPAILASGLAFQGESSPPLSEGLFAAETAPRITGPAVHQRC